MTDITKAKPLPTQERLSQLFLFDVSSGQLIWRHRPLSEFKNEGACKTWNIRFAGKVSGYVNQTTGYVVVTIDGVRYLAHRLIWQLVYGEIPDGFVIDHISGEKTNNRIENLRLASKSENSQNAKISKTNTTGYKGVTFNNRAGKYLAQITINGKKQHLGSFTSPEDAHLVYCQAANVHHGEFANHG